MCPGTDAPSTNVIRIMRQSFPRIAICMLIAANVFAAKDSTSSVRLRVEQALAEKKPADRLKRLSEISSKLSLDEVKEALDLAKGLKEFRERGVLAGTALRRWCELEPQSAFDHIA